MPGFLHRRAWGIINNLGRRKSHEDSKQKDFKLPVSLTMLRSRFLETKESCSRKKEISFRENFWPGKPSKTVISENQANVKVPIKPYAAMPSEVFQNVKTILKTM